MPACVAPLFLSGHAKLIFFCLLQQAHSLRIGLDLFRKINTRLFQDWADKSELYSAHAHVDRCICASCSQYILLKSSTGSKSLFKVFIKANVRVMRKIYPQDIGRAQCAVIKLVLESAHKKTCPSAHRSLWGLLRCALFYCVAAANGRCAEVVPKWRMLPHL